MNETGKTIAYGGDSQQPARPMGQAMRRGALGACPACGKGRLFARMLDTRPSCDHCGEELHHHRADDLPTYLNIFVTGHVVVGLMMVLMDAELLSLWPLTIVTSAVALVVAIALMRPLKGMVVGVQWALAMHGFGGHDD